MGGEIFMSISLLLYIIDVCNSLKMYFAYGLVVSVGVLVLTMFCAASLVDSRETTDIKWKSLRVWIYIALSNFVFSSFMFLAIPSQKTMYMIAGATVAEDIIHNPPPPQNSRNWGKSNGSY